MSDKFEKLSIYNVDYKLTDDDGVEHVFTFKPLPFSRFAEAFDFFVKFKDSEANIPNDVTPEEKERLTKEFSDKFFENFDKETIKTLADLEFVMVSNSYPDLPREKVELFVASNAFNLIEPLSSVTFKQSKANKRKVQQLQNRG